MYVQVIPVTVTTASDGSATTYTASGVNGLLDRIRYVKTDFVDGSTFTITVEDTGESLWTESSVNASATRAPRQATHLNTSGAAALYAAAGTAVMDRIAINGRVKIVIASGGNTKTGTFYIVLV